MQITNAVNLIVELENNPDSLISIVMKSLLKDDPLEELKPELQTTTYKARILSTIKIIDEVKIESFLTPLSLEASKVLTSPDLLIFEKLKKDVEIEMIEARRRIKELARKIENHDTL
ncbi:hypothetical protein CHH38_04305 [Acinetobacter nosocomialis]|uniref:hypothetical protein n=1 Tax=Acinetobacter nosocomialis TaxID=106654 RepID=UPI000C055BF0|nr:hypothetical protein [Acinetobacter nosocomialis]PHM83725.1 hypothetical protein CHH38_04305 [Acinetobacter nosocomialis]